MAGAQTQTGRQAIGGLRHQMGRQTERRQAGGTYVAGRGHEDRGQTAGREATDGQKVVKLQAASMQTARQTDRQTDRWTD